MSNFGPAESRTRTQVIIDEIANYLEEELEPGDKIPSEKELKEQFEVSRSTIREALQTLISLGVLTSKPGRGYFVTQGYQLPLRSKELQETLQRERSFIDLVEARELVERSIIHLAAERASSDDIGELGKFLEEIEKVKEEGKGNITKLTTKIHMKIARMSNNEVLVGLMEQLLPMITEKAEQIQIPPDKDYEMHRDLVKAVKTGNKQELNNVFTNHLEYMRNEFMIELQIHMDSAKE